MVMVEVVEDKINHLEGLLICDTLVNSYYLKLHDSGVGQGVCVQQGLHRQFLMVMVEVVEDKSLYQTRKALTLHFWDIYRELKMIEKGKEYSCKFQFIVIHDDGDEV
jgi:hypothetical protein